MHVAAVHAEGGELSHLEERRARVEQLVHALTRQELAAGDMFFPGGGIAALRHSLDFASQVRDKAFHALGVGAEFSRARIDLALDHPSSSVLPITMRWMSLAPS